MTTNLSKFPTLETATTTISCLSMSITPLIDAMLLLVKLVKKRQSSFGTPKLPKRRQDSNLKEIQEDAVPLLSLKTANTLLAPIFTMTITSEFGMSMVETAAWNKNPAQIKSMILLSPKLKETTLFGLLVLSTSQCGILVRERRERVSSKTMDHNHPCAALLQITLINVIPVLPTQVSMSGKKDHCNQLHISMIKVSLEL